MELRGICKRFGEKQVLQDVSFTAKGGRALGLLGRNGAGKTTTLRILMGVFPADAGQVLLEGRALEGARVGIGYLPEERGLYPKKKIFEQLVYFAQLKGMRRAAAAAAVEEWLARLEMTPFRDRRLDTLSKGNQQKIQLITALVHQPDIVILDEPFSGLDPVNALLLKDVVRQQIADGRIVLLSSHQMGYIEEFCDDIALLHGGRVALQGDLREIKRSYPRDKLLVRAREPQAVAAALGECCTQQPDGTLLVRLAAPAQRQAVMQRLTQQFDVEGICVYEPSLADIFVDIAGDEQQKGGGAP